jgi:hypothetical protein
MPVENGVEICSSGSRAPTHEAYHSGYRTSRIAWRLTPAMFDAVLARAVRLAEG